jgi:CRISPR-associated protein Cas5t
VPEAAKGGGVIGLHVTVPLACWRKGAARELLETEILPPPSTCYGALLSLVGEIDRERHRGCRVTAGLLNDPQYSTVLRTLWRIKEPGIAQGNKSNARPDFQQLVIDAALMIWCDSDEEASPAPGLEARVRGALKDPATVDRFGGWSLGESTHLINDVWVRDDARPPSECRAFQVDPDGDMTLPVWVDHVGSAGTRYAVGRLVSLTEAPPRHLLPRIPPKEIVSEEETGVRAKNARRKP